MELRLSDEEVHYLIVLLGRDTNPLAEAILDRITEHAAAEIGAAKTTTYVVRKGDTLWNIAEDHYGPGHGNEYHTIFDANRAILKDPNKIFPGQVLVIPPLPATRGQ